MKGLRAVSGFAKDAEVDASKSLREAVAQIDNAQETLRQLERYRDEYRSKIESETTILASALVRTRRFVGEIETSIERQRTKVEVLTRELAQHTAHWQECRARDLGLERLISSHEKRISRRASEHEQSQSDDRACHRSSGRIDFTG